MKYLKTYNESNQSINESYFELIDILQSKIFDDFEVVSATDESFDDNNYPVPTTTETYYHKFWLYRVTDGLNVPKDLTGVINSILVFNIGKDENEDFFNSLKDLETIVEDITGKQLIFFSEEYVGSESGEVYDYIIRLK